MIKLHNKVNEQTMSNIFNNIIDISSSKYDCYCFFMQFIVN